MNTFLVKLLCVQGLPAIDRAQCVLHSRAEPFKQRYYPVNPIEQKQINEKLDKMLALGIVEPSETPWSSPNILVKKKYSQKRFIVDYPKVNAVSEKDAYPLPYINHTLDRFRYANYLSTFDLQGAYWQIHMEESSKALTAFVVPGRGLYQFNRMPFDLQTAPAVWQKFIDGLYGPAFGGKVFV